MEEANKLIGTGKKHLVMGNAVEAVNVLQEACGMLGKKYGDTADECGEAFFWCGRALLDLARMENTVLGNALEGVPEEDTEDEEKPKDSNIESTENIDEKTRDELRVQVYDAMAEEKKTSDIEVAKSEGGGNELEQKMDIEDNKTKDTNGDESKNCKEPAEESEEPTKKSEEPTKKSEEPTKKSEEPTKKPAEPTKKPAEKSEEPTKKSEEPTKKPAEPAEKSEEHTKKQAVPTEKSDEPTKNQAEATEKSEEPSQEAEDDSEEEAGGAEMEGDSEEQGEGDDTAEKESDDEEVGNLQLAWEMLEVAKVIFKRKETEEDQLMAAQAHLKLGEVSSESGNYAQALEDFQECLTLQLKYLNADSRLLAETHYQLGLTCGLNCQYAQAVEQFNNSISVIKSRLGALQEVIDKADDPAAMPEERKEMEELQALLPEIREKVEDATEGLKSASTDAQAVKEALDSGSTSSAFTDSTCQNGDAPVTTKSANDTCSSNGSTCKGPVSDISHLVRKKRKPDESPVKEGVAKKVKQDEPGANGTHEPAENTTKMEVESQ